MKYTRLVAAALIATVGLAACGGGSTDPGDIGSATPAGLWTGQTNTGRTATVVVLSDGAFWGIYSVAGQPSVIGGVVNGKTSAWTSQQFTIVDARDYNLEGTGVSSANATALYNTKGNLQITTGYSSGEVLFWSASYDPSYEQTPLLANIAGTYTGVVATSTNRDVGSATITPSGAVSGTVSGCSYSGTVTPRSDSNTYDLSVTFGAAPCLFAGQTLAGLAVYDANARRLYAMAPNASRTDGFVVVGTKP